MSEDTLEVERAGWKAKLKGRDPYPYIIIAALLLGLAYMTTFSLDRWGEPFDLKHAMKHHEVAIEQQHGAYLNGVTELTYVMSVCLNQARQKECERLHLHMPDSLYRKLNNAQQP